MRISKTLWHAIIAVFLTILTQVGGLIWVVNLGLIHFSKWKVRKGVRIATFTSLYVIVSFSILPMVASQFGRTPLPLSKNGSLIPHNYMTVILNRHYVTPQLKVELLSVSQTFDAKFPGSKISYLDACFPFLNGFPLLPHLSHDDGRKIDLSFMYREKNGEPTNSKPSRSGYGYYEAPKQGEQDYPLICKGKGYWQYSFPQYLTLGSSENLNFDEAKTKYVLELFLSRERTHKIFIEPHLKSRLGIDHDKCRYHGCQAVRHDDHIHYQIKG